jgi:hypothetical protein
LARLSLEEKLPRRVLMDPWVKRCATVLRAERIEERSSRTRGRAYSDTILKDAIRVRFAPDPLIGAELEARVLCNSHPELIAERCGLTADVVRAFEAVFFDVRPLLEASGYIFHQVIGRPIIDGFSLDDPGSIWKLYAYMRGPNALDILLFVFPGRKPRPWPSTIPATLVERRSLVATCRLAVLTRCVRIADMSASDRARFVVLSKWFDQLDEVNRVSCFGNGVISQVDLTSLLGSRVEDPDRLIPTHSSPQFVPRYLCAGTGGRALSDCITWSGPDCTDLHIATEAPELVRRAIA